LSPDTPVSTAATAANAASPAPSGHARNIPSLDGIRAFSVLAVVLNHSLWFAPAWLSGSALYKASLANGGNGVATFFVISGFLITTLLLREHEKTGTLSLRRFYFRRSMRIFPAFYVFLLVAVILWRCGIFSLNLRSLLLSATYTWCYVPSATGYLIQHSWSLSIEEQFYLFWPALLLACGTLPRIRKAALAIIAAFPLLRIAIYFAFPSARNFEYYMIYAWLDTMMVGCLAAVAFRSDATRHRVLALLTPARIFLLGCLAYVINPLLDTFLPSPYKGLYALLLSPTLTAFSICAVMLYCIHHPRGIVGRLLNQPILRWLGSISYSVYLWQQLFVSERLHLHALGYLATLAAAAASFYLVERPFLRLRTRLERSTPATPPHTSTTTS